MPIQSCNAVMGKHLVQGSLSGELKVADGSYWAADSSLDVALAGLVSEAASESTARADGDAAERAFALAARDANETARDASVEAIRAALQADVDQNESDADASFTAAATDRGAIRSEFAAADAGLSGSLAGEVSRALAAEAAIQADVDQNEADADASFTAAASARAAMNTAAANESAARQAAEAAIQADVDQNELDADAAILAEQTARLAEVAIERGRIDGILAGSTGSLDSFLEVVAAYEAADGNLQTSITNLSSAAATDRAAIRSEFAAADSVLESSLLGGASATHNTLKKIEDLLDAEIANRVADVDAEETRALAAEAAMNTAAANESAARQAAEAAIQADVDQNELDGDNDRAAIRSEMAANETARDASVEAIRAALQADVDQNESDSDAEHAAEVARLGGAAGFSVANQAGVYSMDWGAGKPKMELTLDGSGGVDVCFSVA